MIYSRHNPSPHYADNVRLCREMQEEGSFTGIGCYKVRAQIRQLIRETESRTILDFGCGRGLQFYASEPEKFFAKCGVYAESWAEALGVERVDGYDPACPSFAKYPQQQYDGVYSVDVMEHISKEDVPWTIIELFTLARKFVFATVALIPAKKNLPNGENAHITLKSREWWLGHFARIADTHPGVHWQIKFEEGKEQ